LSASDFDAQAKLFFKHTRFSLQTGEVEARAFDGADDEDGFTSRDLDVDAGDAFGVLGFEFFGDAQQAG
jgi:hypothetical protein